MDALVEVVRPMDGTQDAEASRNSVRDALAAVLEEFPDANLLELTAEQRGIAVERFLGFDVFRRFQLDMGKALQAKAPDATSALAALKEVKNYVRQTLSAKFRDLAGTTLEMSGTTIARLSSETLRETFEVFKEYVP